LPRRKRVAEAIFLQNEEVSKNVVLINYPEANKRNIISPTFLH